MADEALAHQIPGVFLFQECGLSHNDSVSLFTRDNIEAVSAQLPCVESYNIPIVPPVIAPFEFFLFLLAEYYPKFSFASAVFNLLAAAVRASHLSAVCVGDLNSDRLAASFVVVSKCPLCRYHNESRFLRLLPHGH